MVAVYSEEKLAQQGLSDPETMRSMAPTTEQWRGISVNKKKFINMGWECTSVGRMLPYHA